MVFLFNISTNNPITNKAIKDSSSYLQCLGINKTVKLANNNDYSHAINKIL